MPIGAQSEFAVAFQEFIYYAGPIVQILYWVVLAASAVYAVLLFKRLVEFKAGGAAAPGRAEGSPERPVSVEEFVE